MTSTSFLEPQHQQLAQQLYTTHVTLPLQLHVRALGPSPAWNSSPSNVDDSEHTPDDNDGNLTILPTDANAQDDAHGGASVQPGEHLGLGRDRSSLAAPVGE